MARTRACELIVKLHWRTIPKRLAKSKWTWTRPCLDWHMKAQGVFGMFGMILTIGFSKMVIKWSMTAANANGIFTELVAVEANWNAAQGVSACNIQKGREDTTTFVYLRALADHLGSDTLPDTAFFFRRASPMMRAAEQQAGRVLLVCDTVNMLFSPCFRILQYYSWLATGSVPRMALIWDYTHLQLRRAGDQRASRSPFVQNDASTLQRCGFI